MVVNRPKSAAYRAPGVPSAAFAVETVVDELCEKLGMDPLQFRMINAAREGERRLTGPVFGNVGMTDTVAAVQPTTTTTHRLKASGAAAASRRVSGATAPARRRPPQASTPTAR